MRTVGWNANNKFRVGPNPVEQEKSITMIEPTTPMARRSLVHMIERMYPSATREQQAALDFWKLHHAAEEAEDAVKLQFLRRFYFWLLGRGTADDHGKTLWGRGNAAAINGEVNAYIEQFAKKRLEYALLLAKMSQRVPDTLNGYYLYFKYIVNGGLHRVQGKDGSSFWDLGNDDFLEDFEFMQRQFEPQTTLIAPNDNSQAFNRAVSTVGTLDNDESDARVADYVADDTDVDGDGPPPPAPSGNLPPGPRGPPPSSGDAAGHAPTTSFVKRDPQPFNDPSPGPPSTGAENNKAKQDRKQERLRAIEQLRKARQQKKVLNADEAGAMARKIGAETDSKKVKREAEETEKHMEKISADENRELETEVATVEEDFSLPSPPEEDSEARLQRLREGGVKTLDESRATEIEKWNKEALDEDMERRLNTLRAPTHAVPLPTPVEAAEEIARIDKLEGTTDSIVRKVDILADLMARGLQIGEGQFASLRDLLQRLVAVDKTIPVDVSADPDRLADIMNRLENTATKAEILELMQRHAGASEEESRKRMEAIAAFIRKVFAAEAAKHDRLQEATNQSLKEITASVQEMRSSQALIDPRVPYEALAGVVGREVMPLVRAVQSLQEDQVASTRLIESLVTQNQQTAAKLMAIEVELTAARGHFEETKRYVSHLNALIAKGRAQQETLVLKSAEQVEQDENTKNVLRQQLVVANERVEVAEKKVSRLAALAAEADQTRALVAAKTKEFEARLDDTIVQSQKALEEAGQKGEKIGIAKELYAALVRLGVPTSQLPSGFPGMHTSETVLDRFIDAARKTLVEVNDQAIATKQLLDNNRRKDIAIQQQQLGRNQNLLSAAEQQMPPIPRKNPERGLKRERIDEGETETQEKVNQPEDDNGSTEEQEH